MVHLPLFNILVAIGLAAGLAVFDWLNRRPLSCVKAVGAADRSILLVMAVCVSGLAGSVAISSFLEGRLPFEFPWTFTFFGGVIGAAIGFAMAIPLFRLPLGPISDHLVIGLAIGHGIGRIGCYLGGCCFGRSCGTCEGWSWLPLFNGRLPVQLMEAACEFANFAILLWILLRWSPRAGLITALWLVLYASERFILENFRDDVRGSISPFSDWGLSPSQGIALCCFAVGGVALTFIAIRGWRSPPMEVNPR